MKEKLTLDTKVIFLDFEENKWEKECENKTLGWFLEQMSIIRRRKDIMVGEWFLDADINTDWGKATIMFALVSWLSWLHKYDDIFYRVDNHKIFIDRFNRFHEVFYKEQLMKKKNES